MPSLTGAFADKLGGGRTALHHGRARHPSITNLVNTNGDGAPPGGAESQSRVAAYLHNRWKQRSIRDKMPDA